MENVKDTSYLPRRVNPVRPGDNCEVAAGASGLADNRKRRPPSGVSSSFGGEPFGQGARPHFMNHSCIERSRNSGHLSQKRGVSGQETKTPSISTSILSQSLLKCSALFCLPTLTPNRPPFHPVAFIQPVPLETILARPGNSRPVASSGTSYMRATVARDVEKTGGVDVAERRGWDSQTMANAPSSSSATEKSQLCSPTQTCALRSVSQCASATQRSIIFQPGPSSKSTKSGPSLFE